MTITQLQKHKRNVPGLRFPEFRDEWKPYRLSELLTKYSENNKDGEFSINEILSLSSHFGIVNRKDLLEDTYDNVNHLNYKKTRLDDFVYGKSISAKYPFGLFKVNDCKDGLLSTLYFTFKVRDSVYPKYLDCYFSHPDRANSFLKKYVLLGDRYITADADYLLSGKINIPKRPEQKKIISFLTSVDKWIANLKNQEDALKRYKKGIMQKIFDQEISFKDKIGNSYPDWEKKKLGSFMVERNEIAPKSKRHPLMAFVAHKGVAPKGERYDREFLVSDSENKNYKRTESGDFIYSSNNFETGSIGLNHYGSASISPVYSIFQIGESCDPLFIGNYFARKDFINKMIRYRQGVVYGQWKIHESEFLKIEEKIPSIGEQQKIAGFLGLLDERINAKLEQITKAEQWKKGILQQLFI